MLAILLLLLLIACAVGGCQAIERAVKPLISAPIKISCLEVAAQNTPLRVGRGVAEEVKEEDIVKLEPLGLADGHHDRIRLQDRLRKLLLKLFRADQNHLMRSELNLRVQTSPNEGRHGIFLSRS